MKAVISPFVPLSCLIAAGGSASAEPSERPNIVVILCDDMGYGDLACYGQPYIATPCIDAMAREGMLFTQAYSGSPVSAPSRAALMTGQHTGHCAVRGNREYWRDAPKIAYGNNDDYAVAGQHPLDTAHVVLTEIMKDAGYATAMFGKWAGGYEGSPSVPETRGIDRFFGYICQYQAHLYYPNFLNRYDPERGDTATVRVTLERNIEHAMFGDDYFLRPQYSADMIHREAVQWLDARGEEPFFAMLMYTLPHAELAQPHDSIFLHYKNRFFDDRTWGGQEASRYNAAEHTHAHFAAMIARLDCYVGEVLDLLRRKGLAERTLVLFTSDNGPHEEGGADPAFFGRDGRLRGLKRECYEGGIRVPFIAWWPGTIAPDTQTDHQCAFYDIMPTLCDVAGIDDYEQRYRNERLASDDPFDGISFAPTLLGDTTRQATHDFLYWEFDETDQIAVRSGDWKLIVKHGVPSLYNLADDLHEDRDIADEHPDIVRQIIDIVRREHTPSPFFAVTLPE